jgi:hypothetical protein
MSKFRQTPVDFRLMSRRVVEEINRLKECHGFLRGMVALVGSDKPPFCLIDQPDFLLHESDISNSMQALKSVAKLCRWQRTLPSMRLRSLSDEIGWISLRG